jgi:hypothetical protein
MNNGIANNPVAMITVSIIILKQTLKINIEKNISHGILGIEKAFVNAEIVINSTTTKPKLTLNLLSTLGSSIFSTSSVVSAKAKIVKHNITLYRINAFLCLPLKTM